MKTFYLALAFMLVLGLAKAEFFYVGTPWEYANLTKNWSTTQGSGGWFYQYFASNGSRINLTQDCTGTSGSNYQCWSRQDSVPARSTSTTLYVTGNASWQISQAGDPAVMTNIAYRKYLYSSGNYLVNGSININSPSGDGANYSIRMNGSVTEICSQSFNGNPVVTFTCLLGSQAVGSYVEFDIGMNAGSTSDYGNVSFTINRYDGVNVTLRSPPNNTQNYSVIPFSYFASSTDPIVNASVYTNESGWSARASNSTAVNETTGGINWINITFPANGRYHFAIQACTYNACYITNNYTIYIISNITTVINSPTNNSANSSLLLSVGYTPISSKPILNASVYANVTGWAAIASNNSIVSNNTLNWINTTLPKPGVYTIAVMVCDINNYCNFTLNQTYNVTAPRLRIQTLNETATPTNILYNLTISNGTNTTIYTRASMGADIWFNRTWWEIPTGDLTITIGNSTLLMASRNYYPTFNETDVNLTAYLMIDSLDYEVDFSLKDYAGNNLIGYYINIQRSFFGSDNWTTIAQAQTDYSGKAVLYLDIAPTYRIVVYDANKVFVQTFSPVIIDSSMLIATNTYGLNLIIGQQSSGLIGQGITDSATCTFDNSTAVITCTVTSAGASSNLTIENVTGAGFQQICSDSATPAQGTLSCTITAWNNTLLKYKVYVTNSDGSQYLLTSGLFDNISNAFNWGLYAPLAFLFLIITLASFAGGDHLMLWSLMIIGVVVGKLFNVFNIGWETTIGLIAVLAIIAAITEK